MPKRYVILDLAAVCVCGLLPAISVYAQTKPSEPTVVVSPSSVVPQGTKVTVTVTATPAAKNDVLGFILYTTVLGSFSEFGNQSFMSNDYFPVPHSFGPGIVQVPGAMYGLRADSDGVLEFTADAPPGEYDIYADALVLSGPNRSAYSRSTFRLTVTRLVDAPASTIAKIEDPRFDFDIVIGKDAIPSERYATLEFRKFFAEATGIQLPIVTKANRPGRHIFIGPSEELRESNVGFSVDEMGDEDLRIIIRDSNIAIAGGRPRGTLYGVYTFLEDYLGVRFLTFDHTYVPKLTKWPLAGPVDMSYHPPLDFRWSFYAETNSNHAFAVRMRCNTVPQDARFGGATGKKLINHTFAGQIPSSTYGKAHPEYFALVGGKRLATTGNDEHLTQPCLTNPDVLRIVTESVLAQIRANPKLTNVSVSQNDNHNYCRCEKCAAIDKREGTPMGSLLTFVNAVADEVAKKHPNVKVGTLAYHYSRKPPRTLKPRPNVQIQLASNECSVTNPINDPNCQRNVSFSRDLTAWGRICEDINIWAYNVNFGYGYLMPMPTMRVIEPNIRFFVANGVRGVFMQAAYTTLGGEFSDLRNYITSRLLWDPNLSGKQLMNEFIDLHYDKAAEPIRWYVNLVHDNARAKGIGSNRNYRGSAKEWGLDESMLKAGLKAFEDALRLADNDAVRNRVEKASICIYRLAIDDTFMWAEKQSPLHYTKGPWWDAPPLPPATARQQRPYVKRFLELCHKHGVTNLSEGRTIAPKPPFPGWREVFRRRLALKEGEAI